ncbi:ABC transporter, permease protein [Chitinispirillum alkaliphilum]|nr:ABC transporter, permease protein [Chitinispirillum alkaliphilum]
MGAIWGLVVRNLKVYLRDRAAVFFSFLSMLIIIGLYALFLGKSQVNYVKQQVGDIEGIRFLVDSWIMAGLLAVNSVTIGLGALSTMVQDGEGRSLNDFLVAPIRRSHIVASYLIASWLIGIILNSAAFIIGQVYIVAGGGEILSFVPVMKVIGLLSLCVISSSTIIFFVATYMKTMNSYGALTAILGTVIGFVTGVYVPLSVMPPAVQKAASFVPATHGAAALRQVFMDRPVEIVFGESQPELISGFMDTMGANLYIGGSPVGMTAMIGVLLLSGLLFLSLSVIRLSRSGAQR